MMTKDKALRMALNWLVSGNFVYPTALRTAIEEALAQPEQEPLEYWNAVEGWVKIDEVRKHFETVSCGTIYKIAGEGRVPLYTAPPKREWVGLDTPHLTKAIEHYAPQSEGEDAGFRDGFKAANDMLRELNHD